jgi:hypothetical protein
MLFLLANCSFCAWSVADIRVQIVHLQSDI